MNSSTFSREEDHQRRRKIGRQPETQFIATITTGPSIQQASTERQAAV